MNRYFYSPDVMAAAYGSNGYGECKYQTSDCVTTTGGGSSSNNNSGLVNTGTAALGITVVAVLILLGSFAVRFWRSRKKDK